MHRDAHNSGSPARNGFLRDGVEMGARKRFQFSKR
jgi:hypothetical protein